MKPLSKPCGYLSIMFPFSSFVYELVLDEIHLSLKGYIYLFIYFLDIDSTWYFPVGALPD
jgi:hypothetical protein